jgi:dTDP-4-dehydrorhamnose 3,5-epimerase-like enzyme
MDYKELSRQKHIREDGWLSELVSMNYEDEPFNCLHTYVVSVNPGKIRANHYHKHKEEWIAAVAGKITLYLKDIESGEFEEIVLDTSDCSLSIIYIPPLIAHAVYNDTKNAASLIVFSKTPEDKNDTIPFEVLK